MRTFVLNFLGSFAGSFVGSFLFNAVRVAMVRAMVARQLRPGRPAPLAGGPVPESDCG